MGTCCRVFRHPGPYIAWTVFVAPCMFGSRGLGQFACQRPRCLGPGPSPLHVGRVEQGEEEEEEERDIYIYIYVWSFLRAICYTDLYP